MRTEDGYLIDKCLNEEPVAFGMLVEKYKSGIYALAYAIEEGGKQADTARRNLRDHLTSIAPMFGQRKYFMSDDYSLVDCYLAPVLWRLPHYRINLPVQAKALLRFANRMFEREAFETSLSEAESEMREP